MNEDFETFHKLQEEHKSAYLGSKNDGKPRRFDNTKDNGRGGIDIAPGMEGRDVLK